MDTVDDEFPHCPMFPFFRSSSYTRRSQQGRWGGVPFLPDSTTIQQVCIHSGDRDGWRGTAAFWEVERVG
jgi:hypothetical protein